jgi:hypothetical protein
LCLGRFCEELDVRGAWLLLIGGLLTDKKRHQSGFSQALGSLLSGLSLMRGASNHDK